MCNRGDWHPFPILQDSSPGTPIFVFLSPGVDVAASVEALGRKLGMTADNNKYFAVSLGQGQVGRQLLGPMSLLAYSVPGHDAAPHCSQ